MKNEINSAMILTIHQKDDVLHGRDLCLAVSTDGALVVVEIDGDSALLREKLGQSIEIVEDESEFGRLARDLELAIGNEECELFREVVGYAAATRSSVVRVSLARRGHLAAKTISFDVEDFGGQVRVSTTFEAEAYGAAETPDSAPQEGEPPSTSPATVKTVPTPGRRPSGLGTKR